MLLIYILYVYNIIAELRGVSRKYTLFLSKVVINFLKIKWRLFKLKNCELFSQLSE